MKTERSLDERKEIIRTRIKLVGVLIGVGLGVIYGLTGPRKSEIETEVKGVEEKSHPILTERLYSYCKQYHQGWKTITTMDEPDKDFDEDGDKDRYVTCGDGSVFARLTSKNVNGWPNQTSFWYYINKK